MDRVFIRHLKISAAVGTLEWERTAYQDIVLDVEMSIDARSIAQTDDIHQAIDYVAIRDCVTQFAGQHRFNLIETLADRLANLLLERFPTTWLHLTLTKPIALQGEAIPGVVVERAAVLQQLSAK